KVKKEGNDLTIIATGIMVYKAIEAAEKLETKGHQIEVIDPVTIVPLDKETIIKSAKKTNKVLIVYEAVERAGFGAEIASVIGESDAFDYLDAPITRLGGKPTPIPYNPNLEKLAVPQVEDIVKKAYELLTI